MTEIYARAERAPTHSKRSTITLFRLKDLITIYLMVGIPYLLFAVFVLFPLLWILRYAFYDYDGIRALYVGLDNFKVLLKDEVWWKAVSNTLIMTFGSLVIGIPLSLVFAVILNSSIKGRVFYRSALYFPCLISAAIVGVVFRIMLAPDNGIINELLLSIGFIDKPVYVVSTAVTAMMTLILVEVWQVMGYNMTLILAGLQKIPGELYEAATIDGANEWQKLYYITIPQLGQMLQMIIMLSLLNGLKMFDLVNVLTNGHPNHGTETMVTYIFNYFFEMEGYRAQQGYAASASVVAFLIISLVAFVYFKMSKRLSEN
ncbi:carbohydrate ABC transporter permease [Paenibacillus silviterrae]|uniref:carbohydrate ABC transporter permease n=1 Tax=Paenibacillus silviterrae TaxID=3242194 RepID=UPI0025436EF3|nr:sugar ABC transporter permease [Paenibacillus chinjuensis]